MFGFGLGIEMHVTCVSKMCCNTLTPTPTLTVTLTLTSPAFRICAVTP